MLGTAVLVLIVVAGGCSKGKDKSASTTTAPAPTTSTTAVLVMSPGNPRVTTTISPDIQGGTAGLTGVVLGPSGPVDGATVRIERFVGDTAKSTDVQSTGGGRWELLGVKGGRYRVRAWKSPDLAQVQPEVFFLQGTEAKNLDLRLDAYGGSVAVGSFDPSPAPIGQPSTLTILLSSGSVGPDGVARVTPRPGTAVVLSVSGPLSLQSPPGQVTDATGRAAWRVQCNQPGPFPATLNDGQAAIAVRVVGCGETPAPAPRTPPTTR